MTDKFLDSIDCAVFDRPDTATVQLLQGAMFTGQLTLDQAKDIEIWLRFAKPDQTSIAN